MKSAVFAKRYVNRVSDAQKAERWACARRSGMCMSLEISAAVPARRFKQRDTGLGVISWLTARVLRIKLIAKKTTDHDKASGSVYI